MGRIEVKTDRERDEHVKVKVKVKAKVVKLDGLKDRNADIRIW